MAWWEYVPVVSTIGHALADPEGRDVEDYERCRVTPEDCEHRGEWFAEHDCHRCIEGKLRRYTLDWVGTSLGADFFEAVASVGVAEIGQAIAVRAGGRFLGLSAVGWTGVGTALLIDAAVDFAIVIEKLLDMWDASSAARDRYCDCNDVETDG